MGNKISDEELDGVSGGYVIQNDEGFYDVIDDVTGEPIEGFTNYKTASDASMDAFILKQLNPKVLSKDEYIKKFKMGKKLTPTKK